jgi:hypothetical protein
MNANTLQGQIHHPFARPSCMLPDDSAGRIARELWWTNQFSPLDFLHAHIVPGDQQ